MSLFRKLVARAQRTARWVVRQPEHHPEVAVLERAVPVLQHVDEVARAVARMRFTGKGAKGMGVVMLERRLGRKPNGTELGQLDDVLRELGAL